jgi:glutamate racemase
VIGVFDSGLGGLTVVRRVRERLPKANILFYADQAHVPYGDRSPNDLLGLLRHNLAWIDDRGADAIVMGCNTSCAIADVYGWPKMTTPILDLIDSATIAVQRAGLTRIGVVATVATARSGAYGRRIRSAITSAIVHEVSAPALVPLVEAGSIEGEEPRRAVAEICAQLPTDVEAVILACTHYPILDEQFAAVLGKGILRIDPAIEQAQRVAALLEPMGMASEDAAARYVTSGEVESFRANVARLMNEPNPTIIEIAEEELPISLTQ